MSLSKAKAFLYNKRGYLKKSPLKLSEATGFPLNTCKEALRLVKLNLGYIKKKTEVRRLFFDIETTPNVVYTWRIGWNITISPESIIKERVVMSIHWKWEGEDKVHHLKWDDKQDDKAMLIKFMDVLNYADEIIAHNGDRFDIKWLRTRCIYHRIEMFPIYKTLDTLKKAKTFFNFNSNKLDYISQFLGVGHKTEHEGYSLWLKCLDGDKDAMKKMLQYGDNDVIILEGMYNRLKPYITGNMHHGVHNGYITASCPNCGSEDIELVKTLTTGMGTIQRLMGCKKCNSKYKISNSKFMKL